jgi:hypothetical protein
VISRKHADLSMWRKPGASPTDIARRRLRQGDRNEGDRRADHAPENAEPAVSVAKEANRKNRADLDEGQ